MCFKVCKSSGSAGKDPEAAGKGPGRLGKGPGSPGKGPDTPGKAAGRPGKAPDNPGKNPESSDKPSGGPGKRTSAGGGPPAAAAKAAGGQNHWPLGAEKVAGGGIIKITLTLTATILTFTPFCIMHTFRADQFRMMGILQSWLQSNLTAIGKSKVAGKEAADVVAGLPAVQAKAGLTATETTAVTERRNEQRTTFETRIFSMLGPFQMVAAAANDMELLGLVTIGRTKFREMRPDLQAGVGQQILTKADANAAKLADYAIDAEFLSAAHAEANAFQQGLPDTQTLLDARKNANATYEEVHEAQMTQIYELDKAMGVFETVNPELFKSYKQARALLDTGSKKKKAKGEKPAK